MWVPLHNPILLLVNATDPSATRALNPPGEDTKGFDDLYRQPVYYRNPTTGARLSTVQTVERRFLAQVEVDQERLKRMMGAGDMPMFDVAFVAHVRDLKRRGYMNTDGTPTIKREDRPIKAVHPIRTSEVLDEWTGANAIWIDEVRSASWGFTGRRDLFVFFCTKKTEPL